jgi:uncharacterized protein YcbK (DUF882 family)
MHTTDSKQLSRRSFCALGAMAAGALLPRSARAAVRAAANSAHRALSFYNTHTGETLKTVYCCGSTYEPQALAEINHILRDVRVNEVKAIDVRLLDLLHDLAGTLETAQPFNIISGYRSPATNAMLRARGGTTSGVASHSLHMDGKAIDIRVPGIDLAHLHRAAVSLKRGGVGCYPQPNFVHVDVGRVRYW